MIMVKRFLGIGVYDFGFSAFGFTPDSCTSQSGFGTRTLSKTISAWSCSSPNTARGRRIFTPGVSLGTRILGARIRCLGI